YNPGRWWPHHPTEGVPMPIHDWTRVDAGLFHHFHQDWTIELCRTLNRGRLPAGFTALTDQQTGGPIPDVLTLHRVPKDSGQREPGGGLAVATAPPGARFVDEVEEDTYARRANRIRIQHRHGRIVAVIEVVSPGNKNNRNALRAFVRKAADLIWQGIHLLVIHLFPPSERDPQGIHKAIWDELAERPFELPADKPLTVVAYRAVPTKTAYVEPVAVGDDLPALPIFLTEDEYIPAPLEETYRAPWAVSPADSRDFPHPPPAAARPETQATPCPTPIGRAAGAARPPANTAPSCSTKCCASSPRDRARSPSI